jgi:hypothetical protein
MRQLLRRFNDLGYSIRVEGDKLRVKGPDGQPPDNERVGPLISDLLSQKPAAMTLLLQNQIREAKSFDHLEDTIAHVDRAYDKGVLDQVAAENLAILSVEHGRRLSRQIRQSELDDDSRHTAVADLGTSGAEGEV